MVARTEQVAREFIASLMEGTPNEALYEPTAVGQHNFDAGPAPLSGAYGSSRFLKKILPDFRFDDIVAYPSDGACTLQYVIRASLPDGGRVEAPGCIVMTFSPENRIATMFEYVDTAQLKPVNDLSQKARAERDAARAAAAQNG